MSERITMKKVREDVLDVFNLRKGIFYTLAQLLVAPGRTIQRYLQGERKKIMNSFRLLVLLSALYSLVIIKTGIVDINKSIKFDLGHEIEEQERVKTEAEFREGISKYYNDFSSILTFLLVPLVGWSTYLFFKKSGLNFAEHITAQAFLSSLGFGISIAFAPLGLYAYRLYAFIMLVFAFVYQIRYCYSISPYGKFTTFTRSILSYLLAMFIFTFVIGIIVAIFVYLKLSNR